jgi:hypothetical protein
MSLVGDARVRFIIANSKIRGNRTVDPVWFDDEVIMEIIRQAGFDDWTGYWTTALAQEMTASNFVFLLETHLLDPARMAAEIRGSVIPIRALIMSSLREAFENRESWLFQARGGSRNLEDYRVHPREAAEWFLRRPLDRDKIPATLRAFLDSGAPRNASTGIEPLRTGAPGRPSSMHFVLDEANRRRQTGKAEQRVSAEANYLKQWFEEHHAGSPALSAKTIENKIRAQHRATTPRN